MENPKPGNLGLGHDRAGRPKSPCAYFVMFFLTRVIFSSSITNGTIATGLPTMASEIGIPPQTPYRPPPSTVTR